MSQLLGHMVSGLLAPGAASTMICLRPALLPAPGSWIWASSPLHQALRSGRLWGLPFSTPHPFPPSPLRKGDTATETVPERVTNGG